MLPNECHQFNYLQRGELFTFHPGSTKTKGDNNHRGADVYKTRDRSPHSYVTEKFIGIMDLLIFICRQRLKPRVGGCVCLGVGVMTLWHLIIQSQARDTNIKPGISTVQKNKMLQTMTSLRKEVVFGILTREPRTCWPPTPQSSRPARILHCPPGEGTDSIKEKERGGENIPVSSWNQDKGWGRTATSWTKSDTLCLVPMGKNGLC